MLASRSYTLRSVIKPLKFKAAKFFESQGFGYLCYQSSTALTKLNLQS